MSKRFGENYALRDVSLRVDRGEAVAAVGENGAGKSTLMNIICGIYPRDAFEGELLIDGEPAAFRSVHDARRRGVALIAQETHVAAGLSVGENMAMGLLPTRGPFFDRRRLMAESARALEEFGVEIDPARPVESLSVSEQKLALIAAALARDVRVLVLDEPTAALSERESELLLDRLETIWERGVTTIFVTHRLDELKDVARRIVTLRNGELVAEFPDAAGASRAEIVQAMVGREVQLHGVDEPPAATEDVLDVSSLTLVDETARTVAADVSFTLRAGEVLGLYGLIGAGRTEVAEALFGSFAGTRRGAMTLQGEPYAPRSAREAIRARIGMLTEDRKSTGLVFGHPLRTNITLAALRSLTRWGFVRSSREQEVSDALIRLLDIRPARSEQEVDALSGGNQQKVLLARWLAIRPRVLILDEPTLGVDIGARQEIYAAIGELAKAGTAVLLISSDTEEVRSQCHRVLVMYKGRIRAEFGPRPERRELVSASTGGSD